MDHVSLERRALVDLGNANGPYHKPLLTFKSFSTMTHFPFVLSSSGVVSGAQNDGKISGGK